MDRASLERRLAKDWKSVRLSREQVLAARKLLGWSRTKLSTASSVSNGAIVIIENGLNVPQTGALGAMRRAFEAAGVEFTNGDEPGVRLRKPK